MDPFRLLSINDAYAFVVSGHPDIWLHVDAAWAGVALSLPEKREQLFLADINSAAKSLCINFHKVSTVLSLNSVLTIYAVGLGELRLQYP